MKQLFKICSLALVLTLANTASYAAENAKTLSHKQILTHLLAAELALSRNLYSEALDKYLLVARNSDDSRVAKIATELAIELQDYNRAAIASTRWAELAQDDIEAQLVAATLLLNNEQQQSLVYLRRSFDLEQDDIDRQLLVIFDKLSSNGQQNLMDNVLTIANERPNSALAQLAAAQLAAVQFNIELAESKLKQALSLQAGITSGIELQAKLIRHKHDSDGPALDYLAKELGNYPGNNDLRMFYVSALTDANQNKRAEPQLEILSKDKQYGGDAFIMLGEIQANNGNLAKAEQMLEKALKFENSIDRARFYLGQLAEYQDKNTAAIKWYETIDENSEFHTKAFLRAAYLYSAAGQKQRAIQTLQNASPSSFNDHKQLYLGQVDLLVETGELDNALAIANKFLEVLPNDPDFLYARGVIYSLKANFQVAELDLKLILQQDPNNANALNALGFILSHQADRLNEAEQLLQRALAQEPNNPAFMDSMGWLLFKMGRTEEAIKLLSEAYAITKDPEIAKHLAEALNASGKHEAARKLGHELGTNSSPTP